MRRIAAEQLARAIGHLESDDPERDEHIHEARKAGDKLAAEIWDKAVYYLALGCVNVCRILDPDRIVLTGGMTRAGEDLFAPLRDHFFRLHWSLTKPKTEVSLASLGSDAGSIGAAGVAWQTFGN